MHYLRGDETMKTIMAMYTGNDPLIGASNDPFYFSDIAIVQSPIQAAKQSIELAREAILYDNVLRTSGGFFVTPKFEIGITPGTSFVVYGVSDETADKLRAGIDNYFCKELDYETYRRVLVQASQEADTRACEIGDAVEHAYLNFFGIDVDKLDPKDRIQLVAKTPETVYDSNDCGFLLDIDRYLPAKDIERIFAAVAYFQDIAKELKVTAYSIVVFLHTTDKGGEPCTAVLYSEEKTEKKSTDTDRNSD